MLTSSGSRDPGAGYNVLHVYAIVFFTVRLNYNTRNIGGKNN